jgi:hypothetical protein
MLCSKVEKKGRSEIVSFAQPRFPNPTPTARIRNEGTVNGDLQVVISDASLQNQFTEGGTYPILLTV